VTVEFINETEAETPWFPWPYKLRRRLKEKYLSINFHSGMPIELAVQIMNCVDLI
jgi:hypothetical protein